MEIFKGFGSDKLNMIEKNISKAKIVLMGDLCLDVYWKADMTKSELSRETPHFPLPVVEETMSPGAGGNVACNIAALRPASIKALGVTGKDWRGDVLLKKLQESGIDTAGIVESETSVTNAYCKPSRKGISHVEYEDPRIDFANYKPLHEKDETALMERLEASVSQCDILCVSDQFMYGCITPAVREKIIHYAKQGLRVVVDSRDRIGLYSNVLLKPNEVEGLRAVNQQYSSASADLKQYAEAAKQLVKQSESSVCMTLGPNGCLYTDAKEQIHIPSFDVPAPIDICGAGDTFLSAFSCALTAGTKPQEAAFFANLASGITIKKIGTTGTATMDEIRALMNRRLL